MTKDINGTLIVDKPEGMTSHEVVQRVRKLIGMRSIGHTGTLDPFATGVLVLCIGRATKISRFIVGLEKEYEGEMVLGEISSTYDVDGEKRKVAEEVQVDRARIEEEIKRYRGDILQTPPIYSAIKVGGRRLYKYARRGEEVQIKPRQVTVYDLEITSFESPRVRFRVSVSSGTYVRSLCHDIGQSLGCGAYASALRRTRVGHFAICDALRLEELEGERRDFRAYIRSISDSLAHLPKLRIREESKRKVLSGQRLSCEDLERDVKEGFGGELAVICDETGEAIAVYGVVDGVNGEKDKSSFGMSPLRILAV